MSKPDVPTEKRAALLIRCTEEEANAIRDAARREHRTLSGYVLNALMQRIAFQTKMQQKIQRGKAAKHCDDERPT